MQLKTKYFSNLIVVICLVCMVITFYQTIITKDFEIVNFESVQGD